MRILSSYLFGPYLLSCQTELPDAVTSLLLLQCTHVSSSCFLCLQAPAGCPHTVVNFLLSHLLQCCVLSTLSLQKTMSLVPSILCCPLCLFALQRTCHHLAYCIFYCCFLSASSAILYQHQEPSLTHENNLINFAKWIDKWNEQANFIFCYFIFIHLNLLL